MRVVNGYAAPSARALQPKAPLVHVRDELEELQPDPGRPAPKKLVVEARVAKKFVEVAFEYERFVPVSVLIEPVLAESPPANVLVPCPAPTVIAAAKVEVAVVEVATMTLNCPREPKWLTAKMEPVEVLLVPVAFTKVKFWNDD